MPPSSLVISQRAAPQCVHNSDQALIGDAGNQRVPRQVCMIRSFKRWVPWLLKLAFAGVRVILISLPGGVLYLLHPRPKEPSKGIDVSQGDSYFPRLVSVGPQSNSNACL